MTEFTNKCYKCQYRNSIPGDAHSSCSHPSIDKDKLFIYMLGAPNEINATFNPHGVKNGWAVFPVNFDPAWLENCDGFKAKEE